MGRELTRTAALLALLALGSGASAAGQWVNPREAIQDASLARLQQGRRELTPLEREEIDKYGVTGLEAMTYLDDNKDPGGRDYEVVERLVQLTFGKHLSVEEWINKKKYYFADHRALLAREGIRPGEVENKRIVVEAMIVVSANLCHFGQPLSFRPKGEILGAPDFSLRSK